MIKIEVKRFADNGKATMSAIFLNGIFQCFGIEDEERKVKVAKETRVPNGIYDVILKKEANFHNRYKEKFGSFHIGMLCVCNKPNYVLENDGMRFESILIHIGNYESNTDGCLLLNYGVDSTTFQGSNSTAAYKDFYAKVAHRIDSGEQAQIIYTDIENGK